MIIDLPRLRLRPFKPADAAVVVAALNDWAVAQWLISPPHPYRHADFECYTEIVRQDHASDFPTQFAIARRESDELVGCMAVALKADGVGELGYWLAHDSIPEVQVLKVAHHGSWNGSSEVWAERTRPQVAVISVGARNR